MKTGDFKQSVSLIARVVAKGIKHGIKEAAKARNSGHLSIMTEPTKPARDAPEKVKGAYSYSYKLGKYLKEPNQWEVNNSKLCI